MRNRLAVVLLLLAILVPSGRAFARDWFVAPTGDDGNEGTQAKPLSTLQVALTQAQAGDVVQLRAGIYPKGAWLEHKAGTPEAYITVRSYDGDLAAKVQGGIHLPACSYLRFEGLDVTVNDGQCFNICGSLKPDNTYDKSHHIELKRCRLRTVDTNGVREVGTETLKSSQTEHLLVEECDISVAEGPHRETSCLVDWVWVSHSTMRRCYFHNITWAGVYWKGGSEYDVLEQSVVGGPSAHIYNGMQTADGTGVQFANPANAFETSYLVVRNNIFTGCMRDAISIRNTSWFWIYNNLLVDAGYASKTPGAKSGRPFIGVLGYDGKAPSEHIRVFNNIFLDTTGGMHAAYQHDIGPITDWENGNNCYWNSGQPVPGGDLIVDGKPVDPKTESGAVFANPYLSNPTGTATTWKGWVDLYRPTEKSAALIDRGNKKAGDRPYPAVFDDLEGRKRPQGKGWDIGPFEKHRRW